MTRQIIAASCGVILLVATAYMFRFSIVPVGNNNMWKIYRFSGTTYFCTPVRGCELAEEDWKVWIPAAGDNSPAAIQQRQTLER